MSEQILIFNYMKKIAQTSNNLEKQLTIMSDMAKELIKADRCTLWLHDDKKDILWSKVADGVKDLTIPENMGIAGHVLNTGKEYLSNDPCNDEFYNSTVSNNTGYVTKSIIAIPMKRADGSTFGVMQVINKLGEGGFSEEDIDICATIAHFCEQALMNSILADQMQHSQRNMIFLLSEIVETRSKETSHHVDRVSHICKRLGKLYGMDSKTLDVLFLASAMHDVGKIGIPDAILNKPGRFTDEERAIMQQHSLLGYNILANVDTELMNKSAIIAYEHHEKYDGTGYPRGLKAEEIDIFARIAAVADVFDALACERCYKKPWSKEKIVDLFKEETGKHFDPQLSTLFIENIDSFYKILKRFPD